jgi:ATP-dependent Lon protease
MSEIIPETQAPNTVKKVKIFHEKDVNYIADVLTKYTKLLVPEKPAEDFVIEYQWIFIRLIEGDFSSPIYLRLIYDPKEHDYHLTRIYYVYTELNFEDGAEIDEVDMESTFASLNSSIELDKRYLYKLIQLLLDNNKCADFTRNFVLGLAKHYDKNTKDKYYELHNYLRALMYMKMITLKELCDVLSTKTVMENSKDVPRIQYSVDDIYNLVYLKLPSRARFQIDTLADSSEDITATVNKLLDIHNLSSESKKAIVLLGEKAKTASNRDGGKITDALNQISRIRFDIFSQDNEITAVKEYLDANIYGMEEVKLYVVRYLAKRALNPKSKPKTICLVGSPGVGKTYLCNHIAGAVGRKFYSIAVGGLGDSGMIKGSNPVYSGADSGQIIRSLEITQKANPVVLLDEIDKISSGFSGGKSALYGAFLEILDPNQNTKFRDNFIGVEIDISNIWFICTANERKDIPLPLLDRLDVIEIGDYTSDDKMNLFDQFLWPKNSDEAGLKNALIKWTPEAKDFLIDSLIEPGVRELNRKIDQVCGGLALDYCMGVLKQSKLVKITPEIANGYLIKNKDDMKKIGFGV